MHCPIMMCIVGITGKYHILFFFFFLMIRRPPKSTLFPSPPLSRSQRRQGRHPRRDRGGRGPPRLQPGEGRRSEEHTSELQSPCNLVCRLLLEKKKPRSPSFPYRSLIPSRHVGPASLCSIRPMLTSR